MPQGIYCIIHLSAFMRLSAFKSPLTNLSIVLALYHTPSIHMNSPTLYDQQVFWRDTVLYLENMFSNSSPLKQYFIKTSIRWNRTGGARNLILPPFSPHLFPTLSPPSKLRNLALYGCQLFQKFFCQIRLNFGLWRKNSVITSGFLKLFATKMTLLATLKIIRQS